MPRKYNKDIPKIKILRLCTLHIPTLRLDCFQFKVTTSTLCDTCRRKKKEKHFRSLVKFERLLGIVNKI